MRLETRARKEPIKCAYRLGHVLGLSVTPKLHLLEDHVIDFIISLGGLARFDEEFVERCHQAGQRDNQRQKRSMRDAARKFIHFSRWEEAAANPRIWEIRKEVDAKRKRNFSSSSVAARPSKKSKHAADRAISRQGGLDAVSSFQEVEIPKARDIVLKKRVA